MKQAIAKARHKPAGKGAAKVESVAGVFLIMLDLASRFVKKKKARALEEARDTVYLLVQVSIVLKENVFDRPEVKKFFSDSFRQIYRSGRQLVAMALPKTKGVRPTRTSRTA